jgi:hypothetical protein
MRRVSEEKSSRFDEAAALAEIERLQEALRLARQARTQKSEEFDRFVRSFREPAPSRTSADDVIRPPAAANPAPGPPPPVSARPIVKSAPVSSAPRVAARPRWRLAVVSVAVVMAVIVIALMVPRRRADTASPAPAPAPAPAVTAAAAAPSTESAAPPASSPPPAAAGATRGGVHVELRTVQSVWIRVIVDDETKLERVVPGSQQLSFTGARSIAVRAGSGADVLVISGGQEVPLGASIRPVTRTFAAVSARER